MIDFYIQTNSLFSGFSFLEEMGPVANSTVYKCSNTDN